MIINFLIIIQEYMKISINISHLFSMIAIIVADVYLGFEYKGNVILIVIYMLLMLYIVLMVSVFSYNQRSNKYLIQVMNKFWGIISFILGALLSDILKWGVAFIKDDKLSVMAILICSPAIIELVGLVVSMVAFIFGRDIQSVSITIKMIRPMNIKRQLVYTRSILKQKYYWDVFNIILMIMCYILILIYCILVRGY